MGDRSVEMARASAADVASAPASRYRPPPPWSGDAQPSDVDGELPEDLRPVVRDLVPALDRVHAVPRRP